MAEIISVEESVLEMYSQKVDHFALTESKEDFYNSGNKHALIVLKTMAKYAKNKIKIFAGNLCTEISNDEEYISYLKTFTENGGVIEILLCDYESGSTHFEKKIYKFISKHSKNIKIKTTNEQVSIGDIKNVHFTVVDTKMYRLEIDIDKKIAKCNFNDELTSRQFENKFDLMFLNSQELNIPA